MSEPIVFISHFKIKEGKLDGFKQHAQMMIEHLQANKPGTAWVGSIAGASGTGADFTALGDNVNIAARLASNAKAGEVLISDSTYAESGLDLGALEQRQLELKGKSEPIGVRVLRVSAN